MHDGTALSVLATFLRAFSRLDLDAMLDCFDGEATAFMPAEHQRSRLAGKEAISRAFAAVLARLGATGATSIPLDAEDVLVQEWGDTAVVTWHLRSDHLSRRTCVLRRQASRWLIVHLHASNAPLDA
jgi:ketosteroid isomerase-like protein